MGPFFNGLLGRMRLLDEAEILCDERAARWTGDPAALASCLTEVATWMVGWPGNEHARALAAGATGMAGGSRLERRVRGLLGTRNTAPSSGALARWPLALAPCVIGLAPLAIGAIALDETNAPIRVLTPLVEPAAAPTLDLVGAARELELLLNVLEIEHETIRADRRFAAASPSLRERSEAVGLQLRSLRANAERLDSLLRDGAPLER